MRCGSIRWATLGVVCSALLSAWCPTGVAAEEFEILDHLTLSASDRMRGEFVSWFNPSGPNSNNEYNFFANRARVGVRLSFPSVELFAEAQDTRLVSLPGSDSINNGRVDPPRPGVGPLGTGAVYYANTRKRDQGETILHRGYAIVRNFGLPGVSVKVGRMGYNRGLEKVSQNATVAWVQKKRVSQRLIGNFDFTHVGRGFDAVMPVLDFGALNWTTLVSHPTAGGFEVSANKGIGKIDLISSTASIVGDGNLGPYSTQVFYIYYGDRRDLVATDNRPLAPPGGSCGDVDDPGVYRQCDGDDIRVSTIGANLIQVIEVGPGTLDLMIWGAGQFGDWESQGHQGWAVATEGGYRFTDVPWQPWIRFGFARSSGDDNPSDNRHRTFFQILPTARLYALIPFYNMMNNQDLFLEAIAKPYKGLSLRVTGHWLRLPESRDLLYSGGGATSDTFFGYGGIASAGRNELAYVADIGVNYQVNKYLKLGGYYGHAFGQGVVSANFRGKDTDYGFLEATVAF